MRTPRYQRAGRRLIGVAIVAWTLLAAAMVPGLGRAADTYSCGVFTCVQAILQDVGITCSTTDDLRPRCHATARAGGGGKTAQSGLGLGQTGGVGRYVVVGASSSLGAPRTTSGAGQFTWYGLGPDVSTRTVGVPAALGPVRGCLHYTAWFSVVATAAPTSRFLLGVTDSVARRFHTIERTYCAS